MAFRKRILYLGIVLGFVIYYSRSLRTYFKGNEDILFWLGFLPNFGLAFALPLIYVANRTNRHKAITHFNTVCIVALLILILNEIVDKYQPKRVFDWFDIWASIIGIGCALISYHFYFKNKNI